MNSCGPASLVIVFKDSGKIVPQKLYKYYTDHPEEAKNDCELLCRSCHAIKISEMKEFQRRKR